jgi:hypothetical protein
VPFLGLKFDTIMPHLHDGVKGSHSLRHRNEKQEKISTRDTATLTRSTGIGQDTMERNMKSGRWKLNIVAIFKRLLKTLAGTVIYSISINKNL